MQVCFQKKRKGGDREEGRTGGEGDRKKEGRKRRQVGRWKEGDSKEGKMEKGRKEHSLTNSVVTEWNYFFYNRHRL